MRPTVGRIVHYTNLGDKDGKYPPEQQAAIITKVHAFPTADQASMSARAWPEETQYRVFLKIFYETGMFDMKDVPFSPEYKRGHWTWPPRA